MKTQLKSAEGAFVNDFVLMQFGGIFWIDGLRVQGIRSNNDPGSSVANLVGYGQGRSINVVPNEVSGILKSASWNEVSIGGKFQLKNTIRHCCWRRDVSAELEQCASGLAARK